VLPGYGSFPQFVALSRVVADGGPFFAVLFDDEWRPLVPRHGSPFLIFGPAFPIHWQTVEKEEARQQIELLMAERPDGDAVAEVRE
jgi:hypothetical protein